MTWRFVATAAACRASDARPHLRALGQGGPRWHPGAARSSVRPGGPRCAELKQCQDVHAGACRAIGCGRQGRGGCGAGAGGGADGQRAVAHRRLAAVGGQDAEGAPESGATIDPAAGPPVGRVHDDRVNEWLRTRSTMVAVLLSWGAGLLGGLIGFGSAKLLHLGQPGASPMMPLGGGLFTALSTTPLMIRKHRARRAV